MTASGAVGATPHERIGLAQRPSTRRPAGPRAGPADALRTRTARPARRAAPAAAPEGALGRVDRGVAGKTLLGMQRSHGNAVVSRLASEAADRAPHEARRRRERGGRARRGAGDAARPGREGRARARREGLHAPDAHDRAARRRQGVRALRGGAPRAGQGHVHQARHQDAPRDLHAPARGERPLGRLAGTRRRPRRPGRTGPSTTRPSWTCSSPTARARSSSSRTTTRACRGRTRCSCRWPGSRRCSRCSA